MLVLDGGADDFGATLSHGERRRLDRTATMTDEPRFQSVSGYDLILLAESGRAVGSAREAQDAGDAEREAGATCSAILCAAAACEALLSEELAANEWPHEPDITPEFVQDVRTTRGFTEKWKAFLDAAATRSDVTGRAEYQDLSCLGKLRNHIAHRSARFLPEGEWPRELANCIRTRKLPIREAEGADWTSVLLVSDIAAWAHTTATQWFVVTAWFTPNARKVRGSQGLDPMGGDLDRLGS